MPNINTILFINPKLLFHIANFLEMSVYVIDDKFLFLLKILRTLPKYLIRTRKTNCLT